MVCKVCHKRLHPIITDLFSKNYICESCDLYLERILELHDISVINIDGPGDPIAIYTPQTDDIYITLFEEPSQENLDGVVRWILDKRV